MAGNEVSRFNLRQRRRNDFALIASHKATCMELTARGRIYRRWDIAFKDNSFLCKAVRVGRRNGRKQRYRVRVARIVKDNVRGRNLHHVAEIHNADTVGNITNDRKVM